MNRNRLLVSLLGSALLVPALVAGCSKDSSRDGFNPAPEPTFEPPASCDNFTCSPDRLSRVDCDGNVIPCAAGEGCSGGKCIPACEAAKEQQNTIGCEYFPVVPSSPSSTYGTCYAVLLANVWNTPIDIHLSWGDQQISTSYVRKPRKVGGSLTYDLLTDGKLGPGELAIAFLSARKPAYDPSWEGLDCPADVGAAISDEAWVANGGRGQAFHLETSAPIIAYDMFPYGGASSAFPSASLLLPTSAWGTNYVAVDGYATSARMAGMGIFPYMQVIASEDDTTINLLPKTTLVGGPGLADAPVGAQYTTKLSRGEFFQFTQKDELNGTVVESDHPIAVVGGNQAADVPNGKISGDTLHQQLPPVALMGNAYVATRYRDRRSTNDTNLEIVPWRILGIVDGTQLTYDPPIDVAPTTIGAGELVEFQAPGPFVVRSQDDKHPIYVASYMTAGELAPYHVGTSESATSGRGDPDFVNVVPLDQYLSNYVFLTDPTFGNTNLVFVRSAKDGAKDVTLDCLGPVTGWQRVGSSDYEMARVDLVFLGQPVGNCSNGAHRATSDAPFGLTVWGFDDWASYGYVAGMAAKQLNDVRVPVVVR